MKYIRTLLVAALALPPLSAHAATADEEGWPAFGHALSLVQVFVRIAAQSDDPNASLKAIDDVLAGRSTEANRAMAGLLEEATADMPVQHRDRVAAIGRDLAALARKEAAKGAVAGAASPSLSGPRAASVESSLQARKDLTAMGLSYYDANQFLEAVKRDDALAVELFIAGRGVNLGARDAHGRSAQDIARANGNRPLAELLARSLPAAR